MKDIRFNLKLNETTSVFTLNELKENLTPELFPHFHSGKLAKWLRVRNLDEQAEKVQALLISEKEHQAQLFKNLCDIFGKNMDENEAREILQNYKPSISEQNSNDEIVQSREIQEKKSKNENSLDDLIKWADENNISEDLIPRNKEKLVNLNRLYLGDKKLTMLPESIGMLTNLIDLSLYNNQLVTLPKSIEMLTNLTGLSLFGNPLLATSTKDWLRKKLPNCKIYF